MSKHTPGPWKTCDNYPDQIISVPKYKAARACGCDDETACGEALICETAGNFENACLIAAAPELLEALEKVLPFIPHHAKGAKDVLHPALSQARAAIKKARGEK